MSNFIMLAGLPGVGKSTFRKLRVFGDFIHISTDDIVDLAAEAQGKTYDDLWADMIKDATVQTNAAFRAAVSAGDDIVWDQTNLTAKKRRGVLSQLPASYRKIAVFFEIDEELRQQRLAGRVGKSIPDHVQASMLSSYVRPHVSEGFSAVLNGSHKDGLSSMIKELIS